MSKAASRIGDEWPVSTSQSRGWGPGWPTGVPPSGLTQVDINGVRYPGGVRNEIAELVTILTAETQARGYVFGVPGDPAFGCWGYANRPITGTNSPSNHSWGLAVDINAPRNPMRSPLTTDMPGWMPVLWETYRFGWGGRWTGTPDPMHYEYLGTPDQAVSDTARARADLGQPQPEDDMAGFTATGPDGQNWHLAGVWKRKVTWDQANALASLAEPAKVPFLGAISQVPLDAYREAGT